MGEWLRIEPQYRALLCRLGLDSLEALLAGPGRRVRHSLHTNTYRLEFPPSPGSPKALYIKAYREEWPNPRYLVRASRALGEWRVLHGVRGRGIPAARPVAVGERRRFGALLDAVLVTEEVPGSIDLEKFLSQFYGQPHTQGWCRQKRTYLEALARFTRAMHNAGYVSRGFHPRNILIAPHAVPCPAGLPLGEGVGVRAGPLTLSSAEDGPHFAIIDNPRGLLLPFGTLAGWLGVRDLAALDRRASAYFSRTDRLRFLRAYAGRPLRRCRRLLQRVGARSRVGVTGKPAVRPQPVGPVGLVREGRCWAAFRESGGDGPSPAEGLPPAGGLPQEARGLNPLSLEGRPAQAVAKRLSPAGLLHAAREITGGCVREWKRGSLFPLYAGYGPLGREWQNLRVLEGLGLTVPRWVAFAQQRAWGLACREVLVVAAMPDVKGLPQWLQKSRALPDAGAQPGKGLPPLALGARQPEGGARSLRRALAEALGREIGRAHGGGFCFRTFSAQDLGVRFPASAADVPIGSSAERAAAEPQPVFLNVGAGERRRRLSRRKRVRDLVSLAACFPGPLNATEMLCFFRGYLGRPLTSADKGLVREVLARYLKVTRRKKPDGPEGPSLPARREGSRDPSALLSATGMPAKDKQ